MHPVLHYILIFIATLCFFMLIVNVVGFFTGKNKLKDFYNEEGTNKLTVLVFLGILFVIGWIIYSYATPPPQNKETLQNKTNNESNLKEYPTWSKMPDISQEKKSDTISHISKIEPVEEINTTEKTESKIIDTTLQVISNVTEMPANRKDEKIGKITITERPPLKGHGLLLVRVTQQSDHHIEYSIDGRSGSRTFNGVGCNYDSLSFDRIQGRDNLRPGVHNLIFYDGYGELYNQNIIIEEGKTYIKHFKHEYPFGEKIGKFLILPSKENIECDVIISDPNFKKLDSIRLKDNSFEWNLKQGSYEYKIIPVQPSDLYIRKKGWFYIGAGHITKLSIDSELQPK